MTNKKGISYTKALTTTITLPDQVLTYLLTKSGATV